MAGMTSSQDLRSGSGAARHLALGGVIGPIAFVSTWAGAGAATGGYSPVDDAISELAALGASTRAVMTIAFVVFGAGMCCFALALRGALPGPAWVAALGNGLASFGVATFPLGGPALDVVHGCFAVTAYGFLAATPLLASRPLARSGHLALARYSMLTGVASALLLVAAAAEARHGLFQRAGLTVTDVWIVLMALEILRGRVQLEQQDATSREQEPWTSTA
jgi:hypothetical membrane protein